MIQHIQHTLLLQTQLTPLIQVNICKSIYNYVYPCNYQCNVRNSGRIMQHVAQCYGLSGLVVLSFVGGCAGSEQEEMMRKVKRRERKIKEPKKSVP